MSSKINVYLDVESGKKLYTDKQQHKELTGDVIEFQNEETVLFEGLNIGQIITIQVFDSSYTQIQPNKTDNKGVYFESPATGFVHVLYIKLP